MEPELKQIEEKLEQNKKAMYKLLAETKVAGVYQGESEDKWPEFFQQYINFIKSEIGPRGDCAKAVRLAMSQEPKLYDEVLSLLNLNHKTHIRDIYVRTRLYSPCKQYHELIKNQQHLQKNQQSYSRIMDENSIMYDAIKKGIVQKRGPEHDYTSQIQQIRLKYEQKIVSIRETIQKLEQFLATHDNYVRYMRLKEVMKDFFGMWRQADVKIGNESTEKGDKFEKVVLQTLLPLILKRAKIDPESKHCVQVNSKFYPKTLGEIDISILTFSDDEQKWSVKVVIECKSRLFDIREAYKQVSNLREKGKQKLCTSRGIIDIAPEYQYFIVTTLPEYPFNLPIESKMKEALERASKNKMFDDLESEEFYKQVKEVFKDQLSPLDWLIKYDSDRVIVLNQ